MMHILNEQGMELTEEACDLTCGYLQPEISIRLDAAPIDNVTKFAWADEDYETVQRYVAVPESERRENRLAALKAKLAETDYAIVKIAEGSADRVEYADLIEQRKAWREEINRLEAEQDG